MELVIGDSISILLAMRPRRHTCRDLALLFFVLSSLSAILTTAQSPSFLSIDCGGEEPFTDGIGIEWVTDAGYISSGSNLKIALTAGPGQEAFLTSRYFPDTRNKHCYVLPAVQRTTYLVRAVILHGEATELTLPVKFDVTLDSNLWFTFSLSVDDFRIRTPITYEAILYIERDHIDVCLNEATEGTPWMSSLELRVMPKGAYSFVKERGNGKFLNNMFRYNTGITTNSIVRWPKDEFDRLWFASSNETFPNVGFLSNITALPVISNFADGYNQPPDAVMMDAFVGPSLSFDLMLLEGVKQIYVATYYQDIRNVTATASNPVRLRIGVLSASYNLTLVDGSPFQVYYWFNVTGMNVNITVDTLPSYDGDAFLNALEIYEMKDVGTTFTLAADVTALEVLKTSFGLTSWTGDPCYPVSYNWVTCDDDNRISALYLSKTNITGTIPTEIGDLTDLREIYLDNNNLGGPIPSSLLSLRSLTVLSLDNNSLSGGIPSAFQNKAGFTFTGNPNLTLCQSTDTECNSPNTSPSTSDKKSNNTGVIVGVVVGVAVALVVLIALIFFCIRRKKLTPTPDSNEAVTGSGAFNHSGAKISAESMKASSNSSNWPTQSSDASEAVGPKSFTAKNSAYQVAGFISMNEVLIATRNHQKQIGEGGYGPVYYGQLANGKEVAVKVNKVGAHQGNDEFVNEVALLTRVHHRNLVSLLAFCEEGDERVLIYEYQHNGTLSDLLYGPKAASKPLSWRKRLELALDAAKGLEYLHTGCQPRIIHRDVKSNNILIDNKMVAKVADFGISKSTPDQQTTTDGQVSTLVRGTPGYLDPEYYMNQKLSQKSDVYSFGVVLTEIISGRRPISVNPDGSQSTIINLLRQCFQTGDIGSIADPALNGQYNPESMWKMAEIAWSSVEREGVRRPDMSLVVRGLIEAYEMELSYDPNNPSMNSSFQMSTQRPS